MAEIAKREACSDGTPPSTSEYTFCRPFDAARSPTTLPPRDHTTEGRVDALLPLETDDLRNDIGERGGSLFERNSLSVFLPWD